MINESQDLRSVLKVSINCVALMIFSDISHQRFRKPLNKRQRKNESAFNLLRDKQKKTLLSRAPAKPVKYNNVISQNHVGAVKYFYILFRKTISLRSATQTKNETAEES